MENFNCFNFLLLFTDDESYYFTELIIISKIFGHFHTLERSN